MKKLLTLIALIALHSSTVMAQYYYVPHLTTSNTNPGNLNNDNEYPLGGGLPTGWTTVMTGQATTPATPAYSAVKALPFAFAFNGLPVTHYKVSTSGILTFDTATVVTVPSTSNGTLPSALIPNQSICLWGLETGTDLTGFTPAVVSKTFGTAPNRQHWIMYDGCHIPGTASSWSIWSIVLEESTNTIYIVDQRSSPSTTSLTLGVQIDASTATSVSGSPAVSSLSGTNATPTGNVYYEFNQGAQPAFDAAISAINVNDYLVLAQAPYTISARVENFGSMAISSLKLNYSIDGGATVTSTTISTNVPVFGAATVSHTSTWTPPSAATYSLTVWASDLNGNADMNTANDNKTKPVIVVNDITQRTPLFEVFTSSTCGPCAAASPNLNGVLDANPDKFTAIKYQMNWPGTGDIYYNADGETRRGYYGISSIPNMFVDGVSKDEGSYTTAQLNAERAIPAFMNINAYYTMANQKVTVTGSIDPIADFGATTNLRMHIAVVERKTTGNVSSNGETEFHYVEQKMISNGSGTTITSLTSGTPYAITKTYTFPSTNTVEEFTDLLVVVFVQNNATKEVYQSSFATIPSSTPNSDGPGNGIVKLFPNPANDQNVLMYQLKENRQVRVSAYNLLGERVFFTDAGMMMAGAHQQPINLAGQPAGLYTIQLDLGGVVHTTRMVKAER